MQQCPSKKGPFEHEMQESQNIAEIKEWLRHSELL
jgi:hypothetical protein